MGSVELGKGGGRGGGELGKAGVKDPAVPDPSGGLRFFNGRFSVHIVPRGLQRAQEGALDPAELAHSKDHLKTWASR